MAQYKAMCENGEIIISVMIMCAILFEWVKLVLVANKVRGISMTIRVKAVCFLYIMIAACIKLIRLRQS